MSELLEDRTGGVVTLTLNRPESRNALNNELIGALIETLRRLGEDDGVGAIVLTGSGNAFCSGGDIQAMATRTGTFEQRADELRWKHHIPMLLRTMPKIIIAAVNGAAAGAGMSLALACDLRLMSETARFIAAWSRVGYSGDFGGSYLLTRLVGPAKARELYLLAGTVEAKEALTLGLATRVVPPEALMAEAKDLAARIAQGPRIAFGYMKQNLNAAEVSPFAEILELEAVNQTRTALTEDHREAVRAFAEKRAPVFRGR